MKTRTAEMILTYNGAEVTTTMGPYLSSVTYIDPASCEADSLDIAIHDRDGQWSGAWLPTIGDTMTATIRLMNWKREGEQKILSCGFFILDEFGFSGWPTAGNISGLSAPADGAFMSTEKSKTWERVTLSEIAKEKAAAAGITAAIFFGFVVALLFKAKPKK